MDEAQALTNAVHALQRGDTAAAIAAADASLARSPDLGVAHLVRGRALLADGETGAALAALERSVQLDPASGEALATLGDALRSAGRVAEAVEVQERALACAPDTPTLRVRAAHAHLDAGDLTRAEELVRPPAHEGHAGAIASLVDLLEQRGALSEAAGWIERHREAIASTPEAAIGAARTLRQLGRNAEGLALLAGIEAARLPAASRCFWLYALGDALDHEGRTGPAFEAWREANELRRLRFDASAFAARVGELLQHDTRDALARRPAADDDEDRPVFVVGVPRSGTSLVEQILASHPRVLACGERDDLPQLSRGLDRTSASDVERAARAYLAAVSDSPRWEKALRITDKLPHNAFHLGVAAQLFPAARVVHCTRDELDTGLSIFSRDFHASHDYATELESIAAFQRGYRAVMAHWREHLPLSIFELRYETLVAEPEKTMRELLAFCGLEWNAAVLRFHQTARIVNTAARSQVRQPLDAARIGRWRRYERELEPLRRALLD
jgi:tetratricopeptide (TPR) repeat protein